MYSRVVKISFVYFLFRIDDIKLTNLRSSFFLSFSAKEVRTEKVVVEIDSWEMMLWNGVGFINIV